MTHNGDGVQSSGMRSRLVGISSRAKNWLAGLSLVLTVACAHRSSEKTSAAATESQKTNQVVLYLDGAERQAETDEQRQEILRALEDLRTLAPRALKQQRYADYENRPAQWTLVQLMQKYFVPRELRLIDEEMFYRDAQSPRARDVVGQQIRALREGRQVVPLP